MSNFNNLPYEIYQNIYSYLYFKDIYKVSETNSLFYKLIKKYYTDMMPIIYKYICKTVKHNIINKKYSLLNCNIIYYSLYPKVKELKYIKFIGKNNLKNGIYYYSENISELRTISNELILEYFKDIVQVNYVIIYKNNDKIFLYNYKKSIIDNSIQEMEIIDLEINSKILRIF